MKEIINKVNNTLKNNKKRIIRVVVSSGVVIVIALIGSGFLYYNHVKSNINYTQEQAQNIALQLVQGEVIKSSKDIDDGELEYEFKIKDKNNILREVVVSSNSGAVIDCDND